MNIWSAISLILHFVVTIDSLPINRIINGIEAEQSQFPWHVSIIGEYESGAKQLCGGSLIAPQWIATAAHCVKGMVSLKLGLGSNLLMEPFRSFENVTEYFIHPAYNPKLKHNDVALIKLPERVEDDRNIQAISLPCSMANVTYNYALGRVSGYGRYIDENNVVSRNLLWTYLQVIPNEYCERVYGNEVIVSSTMCASSVNSKGQNTCNGDSGGALVLQENGKVVQIGIVSFAAFNRCGAGIPSGFMRIRPYLKWFYDTMNASK